MRPLRFSPIFKRYLWGGQRLRELLGKPTGEQSCAESWELVDHMEDQSIVIAGEFRGWSLARLLEEFPEQILGLELKEKVFSGAQPEHLRGRFPLLVKFLDAARDLSVQVHPDDGMGKLLDPPDLGKTEAWFVIDAQPGSLVYAGLKEGVTEADLRNAVKRNTVADCLHRFEPQAGDCILVRAGTVHAIGAGLMVAEIQQASNTTFRLFDWNRLDNNGQPRELHVEQGFKAIDFELGPVHPIRRDPDHIDQPLVRCDKFTLRHHALQQGETWESPSGTMSILTVIQGSLESEEDPVGQPVAVGQTVLVPAASPPLVWTARSSGPTEFLEVNAGDSC